MKRLWGAALVPYILVSACALPTRNVSATSTAPIVGRVDFPQRSTQATLTDVALAATVSLVSASTGVTAGSTVTTTNGAFTLKFGIGFTPQAGQTYYLEAVKGLSANMAGEPALRVRTLLMYQAGAWVSLTGSFPGASILINEGTTALSAIASLKGLSNSAISAFIGSLDTSGTFNPPNADIGSNEFSSVKTLVQDAMGRDQDPFEAIAYDSATGAYALAAAPLFLDALSPTSGAAGSTVTLYGAFPKDVNALTVLFNGDATATLGVLSPDRRQLTVTVPSRPGTGTFPVSVQYGNLKTVGQTYIIQ